MSDTTRTTFKRPHRTQQQLAVELLPTLIQVADRQTTVTYKDVADTLGIYIRGVRLPLGYLWKHALDPMGLPDLWTLVVSSETGFSSEYSVNASWDYTKTPVERGHLIRAVMQQAHAYPWALVQDQILARLDAGPQTRDQSEAA